jgi:hypothetical protein
VKNLVGNSKKMIVVVVMELENVHDVLQTPQSLLLTTLLNIALPHARRLRYLDLVMVWTLEEFKVGIANSLTVIEDLQQLFLENIKKLT